MPMTVLHRPVLLKAVVTLLKVQTGTYVDATVGTGGHSLALLNRLERGRFIGIDGDPGALEVARGLLESTNKPFTLIHGNFRDLAAILQARGIKRVNGLLFDLGVSSFQLWDAERGFSFRGDARLDMRMDPAQGKPAEYYLNRMTEQDLARVFREFGEIFWAPRLAREIVRRREKGFRFRTAQDLVTAVRASTPKTRAWRKHPATRAFMALRILVNDELGALEGALKTIPEVLAISGRVVILSYHSLEDRRVKHAFLKWEREGLGKILEPFPMKAPAESVADFPESRSVRLRAFEREESAG